MHHTINDLIAQITITLEAVFHNEVAAEHTAWWLLEKLTGKQRLALLVEKQITLTREQEQMLDLWLYEMVHDHKPLAYILGTVPFLGLTLTVEPPILIPRPETEEWCAALIRELKHDPLASLDTPFGHSRRSGPQLILDLCTGSGCLALALAQAFPQALATATDIEPQALKLAQYNAEKNNITNVRFVESDVYKHLNAEKYDVIVANPPYITEAEWPDVELSVKNWEDHKALTTSDNGLYIIKKIIGGAPERLVAQGCLWIEIGYHQGPVTKQLFEQAGFKHVRILKDMNGNDRVVTGTWE